MRTSPVRCCWLLLPLLLASPSPLRASSQTPEIRAELVHEAGKLTPGEQVLLRVELAWDGRPEVHLPGRPELAVPRGASIRLGRTETSFGEQTQTTSWHTDVVLRLPESEGPWTLGPGSIPLVGGKRAGETLRVPKLELGSSRPRPRSVDEALGSGLVLLGVLLYLALRWRRLTEAATSPELAHVHELLERASIQAPEDALKSLIQARLALEPLGVDNASPPTAAELQERYEAVHYGGEVIASSECQETAQKIHQLMES